KDFIKECNHQNIYARVLYDRDKKPYIKYGLKDNSFYIKDSILSARFRFLNLMNSMGYKEGQNLKDFSRAEQFGYIENGVNGAMKNNHDFESFNKELIHRGIEPIYEESNEGIYNVKFRNCNALNPIVFDCNDFGLTYKILMNEVNQIQLDVVPSFETTLYENLIFEKDQPIIA